MKTSDQPYDRLARDVLPSVVGFIVRGRNGAGTVHIRRLRRDLGRILPRPLRRRRPRIHHLGVYRSRGVPLSRPTVLRRSVRFGVRGRNPAFTARAVRHPSFIERVRGACRCARVLVSRTRARWCPNRVHRGARSDVDAEVVGARLQQPERHSFRRRLRLVDVLSRASFAGAPARAEFARAQDRACHRDDARDPRRGADALRLSRTRGAALISQNARGHQGAVARRRQDRGNRLARDAGVLAVGADPSAARSVRSVRSDVQFHVAGHRFVCGKRDLLDANSRDHFLDMPSSRHEHLALFVTKSKDYTRNLHFST